MQGSAILVEKQSIYLFPGDSYDSTREVIRIQLGKVDHFYLNLD